MDTLKMLFALIRSEICGEEIDSTLKTPLSEEELQELFELAKKHDVAHLLSAALYKQGILGDDTVSQKFKKEQMLAVYRCESMKHALGEICGALEKAKIPYVPLKGAVIRPLYPEEWMRTSCDIDILVHEEDLDRAVEILVSTLDYRANSEKNYHDISLYSPKGIHLELHFSIKESMDNIDGLLSEVWSHVQCQSEGSFLCVQSPEYFMFHHIAHISYHFVHGGCGIKPFMDMYIIENKMEFDDGAVRAFCRQCGMEEFYEHMLHLTDVWFANAKHTPLSRKVESYILEGGVYGTFSNKIMLAQNKQGGKLRYALSRVFMPYASLKTYYPILEKHKWLYPFVQVFRWFRILFGDGLKRGVREMKVSQGITQKQSEGVENMLEEIGL